MDNSVRKRVVQIGVPAFAILAGFAAVDPLLASMGASLGMAAQQYISGISGDIASNLAADSAKHGWSQFCNRYLNEHDSTGNPLIRAMYDSCQDAVNETEDQIRPSGGKHGLINRRDQLQERDPHLAAFFDSLRDAIDSVASTDDSEPAATPGDVRAMLDGGPLNAMRFFDRFVEIAATEHLTGGILNLLPTIKATLSSESAKSFQRRIYGSDEQSVNAWKAWIPELIENNRLSQQEGFKQLSTAIQQGFQLSESARERQINVFQETVRSLERNVTLRLDQFMGFSSIARRMSKALEDMSHSSDPGRYYNGTAPTWLNIAAHHDSMRLVTMDILEHVDNVARNRGPSSILVRALSGEGKSTVAMRVAASLYELGYHVLWHDGSATLGLEWKQFDHDNAPERIIAIIDNAHAFEPENLVAFFDGLHQVSANVTVIMFARRDLWQTSKVPMENTVPPTEFNIGRLQTQEVIALLDKLDQAHELGKLELLSREEQIAQFESSSDGQLLIALLEAKVGAAFSTIIQRSVAEIERRSPKAATACKVVSALQAFDIACSEQTLKSILEIRSLEEEVLTHVRGTLVEPEASPGGLVMRHGLFAVEVFSADSGRIDRLAHYIEATLAQEKVETEEYRSTLNDVNHLLVSLRRQQSIHRISNHHIRELHDVAAKHSHEAPDILFRRGMLEIGLKNRMDAERYLLRSVQAYPGLAVAWSHLAQIAFDNRETEQAEEYLKKAIDIEPYQAEYWMRWVRNVAALHGEESARRIYRRAESYLASDGNFWEHWALFERRKRNFTEARTYYGRAAKVNPHASQLWVAWASFEYSQKNRPEARRILREGAQYSPTSADLWHRLGQLENNPDRARESFSRAAKLSPRDTGILLSWAALERREGEMDEARLLYEKASAIAPQNGKIWINRAELEYELGDLNLARRYFETGERFGGDYNHIWTKWARFEYQQGYVDRARELLETGTKRIPQEPQIWLDWAKLELKERRTDRAFEVLQTGSVAAPGDPQIKWQLAQIELQRGNDESALAIMMEATKHNPRDTASWMGRARAEMALGKFSEAEISLDRVAMNYTYRDTIPVLKRRAQLEIARGRYEHARDLFSEITKKRAAENEDWIDWASLEQDLGNFGYARELLLGVIEHSPSDGAALLELAKLETRIRNFDRATSAFERSTAACPTDANIWCEWARLDLERGHHESARQKLETATTADPLHAQSWSELALIEAEHGSPNKALDYANIAVDLDSQDYAVFKVRSDVYQGLNRCEQAHTDRKQSIHLLRKALVARTADTIVQTQLAGQLIRIGELEEAGDILKAAINGGPAGLLDHPYMTLGELFSALGKESAAKAATDKADEIRTGFQGT